MEVGEFTLKIEKVDFTLSKKKTSLNHVDLLIVNVTLIKIKVTVINKHSTYFQQNINTIIPINLLNVC